MNRLGEMDKLGKIETLGKMDRQERMGRLGKCDCGQLGKMDSLGKMYRHGRVAVVTIFWKKSCSLKLTIDIAADGHLYFILFSVIFQFGFESRIWVLIMPVHGHCLSFIFSS